MKIILKYYFFHISKQCLNHQTFALSSWYPKYCVYRKNEIRGELGSGFDPNLIEWRHWRRKRHGPIKSLDSAILPSTTWSENEMGLNQSHIQFFFLETLCYKPMLARFYPKKPGRVWSFTHLLCPLFPSNGMGLDRPQPILNPRCATGVSLGWVLQNPNLGRGTESGKRRVLV